MYAALLLAATALAASPAGCGGGSSSSARSTGPTEMRIEVQRGLVAGGLERATFKKGDLVALVVLSDEDELVHLHGYDLSAPVKANVPAKLVFRATVPGRFEIWLHRRDVPIGAITVEP